MKEREQSHNNVNNTFSDMVSFDMHFLGIPRVESSDWQEAHPGPAPIRKCGDGSPPFAAADSGLAGRGRGGGFHLGGLEEGGRGSFQRCLKDKEDDKVACPNV